MGDVTVGLDLGQSQTGDGEVIKYESLPLVYHFHMNKTKRIKIGWFVTKMQVV